MIGSDAFVSAGSADRAVALGYFDGVHAGHRAILEKLCYEARARHLTATVQTFSQIPKSKRDDSSESSLGVLTTTDEKCAYFALSGVDEAVLFPFTDHLAHMEPEIFLDSCLRDLLHARVIVAGEDYRFGRDRKGDMNLLRSWGEKNGVEVFTLPQLCFDDLVISATAIKTMVRDGDVKRANKLLGYPLSYQGIVQEGRKIGRTLGFPTANVPIEEGKIIPAFGVYASLLHTRDGVFPSITSIGVRPTVNKSGEGVLIETSMFDRNMDLYGQAVRVYLLSYIRGEQQFKNVEILKEQVFLDMQKVRQYHGRHTYEYSILLPGVV